MPTRKKPAASKRFVVEVWDAEKRYWRTYDSWAKGSSVADVRRNTMNRLPDLTADEIRVKAIAARKSPKRSAARNPSRSTTTKAEALKLFRKHVIPALRHKDRPAVAAAWVAHVDALHRDRYITAKQADTWDNPFYR